VIWRTSVTPARFHLRVSLNLVLVLKPFISPVKVNKDLANRNMPGAQ
jgi:hypothetical protein